MVVMLCLLSLKARRSSPDPHFRLQSQLQHDKMGFDCGNVCVLFMAVTVALASVWMMAHDTRRVHNFSAGPGSLEASVLQVRVSLASCDLTRCSVPTT